MRSPLATNYRYYQHNQFTTSIVDSKVHYALNDGETPFTASLPHLGHIYVLYDYDAAAGIDLSGATEYGMFIKGSDGDFRMLGSLGRSTVINTYTQPIEHNRYYSFTFNGGTYYDPYDVTITNVQKNKNSFTI